MKPARHITPGRAQSSPTGDGGRTEPKAVHSRHRDPAVAEAADRIVDMAELTGAARAPMSGGR
ncbi:hypothetical protein [Streptomyces sp. NPDC051286]|uniref:hypothetical protein n=1 Tax=Streptomyces sp. NPDC051286 TaxID=3365647 RepID=UPI0037B0E0C3